MGEEEVLLSGEIGEIEGGEVTESCFGEYGKYPETCSTCHLRESCKRFTAAERIVSLRYKGKYTGTGKEKKKESY